MAFVFKFPDLGEGVHEGKIVKWLVKDGDVVKADAIIGEVETDKAIVELPCPSTGTMLKLYFKEGEMVKVGQILLVIGNPGETVPPQLGGESHAGVSLANVVPMPATSQHVIGVAGEKDHYTISGSRPAQPAVAPLPSASASSPPSSGSALATPAVRNLARQLNVDISRVVGTGHGGRISAEDVQKAIQSGSSAAPSAASPAMQAAMPSAPAPTPLRLDGPVERVSMSSLRKAVARKMLESISKAPQVTHFEEADVTDLWALRESLKADAAAKGIHLTLLPFAAKAVLVGLKQLPVFNASLDEMTNEIVYKKYYNLGIAVDTPDGLIVVNVKDADKLGVFELARRINDLAARGRERKASMDEMRGSTFTITNIGSVGGNGATPIINHPETAILGLYRSKELPRVVNGAIVARKIMPLTVTYDHRIIDGGDGARFAAIVASELQKPSDYWRSQL
jgi:pyruvate dehydrogenase E2 component (dihydrolipoamide acetyltransferase)